MEWLQYTKSCNFDNIPRMFGLKQKKSLSGKCFNIQGFPGGSVVKNLPANVEMQVQFLGWEDLLEKEMVTHSSIFVWRIQRMEEPGGL